VKDGRRHPVVGSRVVIGAGAIVLGPVTVGDDSKIGAGAVVLSDVPSNRTAVGVPARLLPKSPRQARA
jgi:serine O-acetyltransferase